MGRASERLSTVIESAERHAKEFAALLCRFTGECVDSVGRTTARVEFEHTREAGTAFLLLRGHARALQLLVDAGPATYPSGWPIARSMLEVGLRTAWRMDCDDPFEAEARWLAWLGRAVRYERDHAVAAEAEGLRGVANRAESRADSFGLFHQEFVELLAAKGVKTPKGDPPMSRVIESLGLSVNKYQAYAEASERLHGAYVGLEAYSRNLGTNREYGEFAQWHDWIMPLAVGMRGTYVLAQIFASRTKSMFMWEQIRAVAAEWEQIRDVSNNERLEHSPPG